MSVCCAAAHEAAEQVAELILQHGRKIPGTARHRHTADRITHVMVARTGER
jgi:preprotein translocase subunit SecY